MAKIDLFLPYCHSLKEKRHIVRKIKDKIWARYKVSLHEVAFQDKWQRLQFGFAIVNNDSRLINSLIDQVIGQIEDYGLGEMTDSTFEIISF